MFAWCIRWIAVQPLVFIPVVSRSQKRNAWASAGWRSTARWAECRWRYTVTETMVAWVRRRAATAFSQRERPRIPSNPRIASRVCECLASTVFKLLP